MALKQKDDFEGAENALRRAVALDASLPEPPYTLAVVLWQTGRPEDAVPLLRTAVARKPDYADAHYVLGTVLKQLGRSDEALSEFRETIRHQPSSAEAHLSLGQLLQQKKLTSEAAAAFAEAQRLTRMKADAQAATFAVGVGLKRMKDKDTAGAIERFREAVRLAPDYPEAHYQLALALQASGARTEAQRQFAEAHRLAPHLKPLDGNGP